MIVIQFNYHTRIKNIEMAPFTKAGQLLQENEHGDPTLLLTDRTRQASNLEKPLLVRGLFFNWDSCHASLNSH